MPPHTVNSRSVELSIEPPPTSSAAAQSVKQVLSEVLSDLRQVLSARPECCHCSPGWTATSLRGLLIKVVCRMLGKFDGEEGLNAGV